MVIAIVVVLGTIMGVSLVVVSTTQQVGASLDLQGVRAYYAARAGLDWGLYHVLRTGFAGCAGVDGKSIVFGGNLAGFRSTVACSESLHEEGSSNVTMYAVTSTACSDDPCTPATPGARYVERQVRATLSK
jgi:MSHA biogenesis protein MshP